MLSVFCFMMNGLIFRLVMHRFILGLVVHRFIFGLVVNRFGFRFMVNRLVLGGDGFVMDSGVFGRVLNGDGDPFGIMST